VCETGRDYIEPSHLKDRPPFLKPFNETLKDPVIKKRKPALYS